MEQPPAANQTSTSKGTFRQTAGSCLRFLVRTLLTILLAVALGLGVYFGAPILYRTYVQPFENSMQRLSVAQMEQEQTNQQLKDRLQALQSRLDALELQSDNYKQQLDEAAQTVTGLDTTLQAGEQALEERDARIDELSQSLEQVHSMLDKLEEKLTALETEQTDMTNAMEGFGAQLQAQDSPFVSLRNELQILKSMEYITRCRMFLGENNLGLAAAELRATQALLRSLQEQVPDHQKPAVGAILERLQAAASNLPARPLLVAKDLEIAWQLLQTGLPDRETPASPAAGETPTPIPTP